MLSWVQRHHKQTYALWALLATVLLWSSGGILIKTLPASPMAIAGWRSLIALAVILAYLRPHAWCFSKYQILGALAYAFTVVLFVLATKWTTAANAVLLQYSAPIYVALFGIWFLREPARLLDWSTMGLGLLGMTLFFYDQLSWLSLWGNLAAMGAGFSFAWLILILRHERHGQNLNAILLGNALAVLMMLPWMLPVEWSMSAWASILFLGVFQMALAYLLYSYAIKFIPALQAVMIQLLEPLLNPLWVFIGIGEVPGSMALVGGSIILFAVTIRQIWPHWQKVRSVN